MQQIINPNGHYMTVSQLSKLLKISSASILAAIKNGEIKGALQLGSSYRVDVSIPFTTIQECKVKSEISQEKETIEQESETENKIA